MSYIAALRLNQKIDELRFLQTKMITSDVFLFDYEEMMINLKDILAEYIHELGSGIEDKKKINELWKDHKRLIKNMIHDLKEEALIKKKIDYMEYLDMKRQLEFRRFR